MSSFYYADALTETDSMVAHGQSKGRGLESGGVAIPPCSKSLEMHLPRSPTRFVLALRDKYNTPAPGWVPRTSAEVGLKYPGLVGGS